MAPLRIVISSLFVLALVSCQTPAFQEQGWASYVADSYAGRMTSSGQVFHPGYATAAHNTLPFGTEVTVKNMYNGRTVKAMVNDRFPYYPGRVINLSSAAANHIGMTPMQLSHVQVTAYRIPQGGYGGGYGQQQAYPQQQAYHQPQQTYPQQQPQQAYSQPYRAPAQQQPVYPQQQQAAAAPVNRAPTYPGQASAPRPVTAAPSSPAPAASRPSFFQRIGGNGTPAAPAFQGGGGPPPGLTTF